MSYDFAINKLKLDRALKEAQDKVNNDNNVLKAQNKEQTATVTDELVKEIYVRLGGLLASEAPQVITTEESGIKRVRVKRKSK